MTTGEKPLALVLGATGGIGGAMAATLFARGYRVRALHRNPGSLSPDRRQSGYEWVAGDAMREADVARAGEGTSLIVHAVNPPGYRDWDRLVLPMLDSTIAAARQAGARVLLPGTIYNYGPDSFPVLKVGSPENPGTPKGRIRREMEQRLERAADSGVPVLIVRAGDFFGPGTANSWFSGGMVKTGKPVHSVTLPGSPGIGHSWAYLPDVAETMMQLLERGDELPRFARYHMRGVWDEDGMALVEAIRRVTGRKIGTRRLPWGLLRLASPFQPLFRELLVMRYVWQEPLQLDNAELVKVLGAEPHTALDDAMRATLSDMKAL
nr:NAD-dependent epimerase/dehydratase family protein [uncultured Gellertiella sp.]